MKTTALQDDRLGADTQSALDAPRALQNQDLTDEPGEPSSQWSERRPIVSPRRGTLLVVDDEIAICSSLRRVFAREYFVTVATSSAAALELFRNGERFDVVLCDLMMPEVNGVELFQAVRRMAYDQSTRVVFMSGASLTAAMSAFLSSVPNLFVAKPFDMSRLSAVIRERVG